jgi:hypothetical protein
LRQVVLGALFLERADLFDLELDFEAVTLALVDAPLDDVDLAPLDFEEAVFEPVVLVLDADFGAAFF